MAVAGSRDPFELDDAQRRVVEHGEGPLLVLGGAGTGKTALIARRIGALAERGTPPERVLALARSDEAAERLRTATEGLLAAPFEELWATTFHGFAARLLRREASEAGLDPFFEPLGPAERLAMLLDRIDELSLRRHEIRGNPARLLAGLIGRIDRLKAENVSAAELEAWAAERERRAGDEAELAAARRERELAELYARHDRMLRDAGGLDFGDLAIEAARLLGRRPDVRRRAAGRFDHVLVDDFQDASPAQRALLAELAPPGANLCAMADDEQAIERPGGGRGFAAAAIAELRRLQPGIETVALERGYRCARDVLDAGRAVIAGQPDRLRKRLTAATRAAGEVRFWRCRTERAQAQAVAAEIEALIAAGEAQPGQIGVLVDSVREEGRAVAAALEERGIPFRLRGGGAFFQRAEVRDVIAWLRLFCDPSDAGAVVRALTRPPIELRSVDLARCTTIARRRKLDMVSALQAALESPQLPPEARDRIRAFLEIHRAGAAAFEELRPDVFVRRLIERIGLRRRQLFAAQPDTVARLVNVARLGELAAAWSRRERQGSTRDFARYLAAVAETGIGAEQAPPAGGVVPGPAVEVMAMAAAGGLELDRVYLLGLHAGRMPGPPPAGPPAVPPELAGDRLPGDGARRGPAASTPPGAEAHAADRRRLLYVAMTRARRALVLAWPESVEGGAARPSPFYEQARAALGGAEESIEEQLFGPAEGLHSTFRMMRDELLEAVSRVGGNLGELRLDTYMDVNRAVARYLELIKLSALVQRPAGQPLAEALEALNQLLAQVATPEQAEALAGSALDEYLLDTERDEGRRRLAAASREEPSLEAFLPRRGEGLLLSATDIETYRACPLKYKFARVFTIPSEPTINQRFGILVHQVLERFHAAEAAAEPPEAGLQRLLALLDGGWRRAGFGSSDDELQFRDRAVAALTRYWERQQQATSEPVWFERGFAFRVGPHHVRGRVDRVDRLPDGGYELIDYKTGRARTAEELREEIQLPLYGLGARRAWRIEPAAQSYYYLLDDRKVALEPLPDDPARVEQTVSEVGEGVLGQDFEPKPSYELCSWCDYRLICPAAEL